jgi:hypothetical protein
MHLSLLKKKQLEKKKNKKIKREKYKWAILGQQLNK